MKQKMNKYISNIVKVLSRPELSILPANIAFFFVLAIIPFLTIMILIASYFSISVDLVIDLINEFLPPEISNFLVEVVSGKGFDKSVGIFNIIAFFLATNSTYSVIMISNSLYKVKGSGMVKDRINAVILLLVIVLLFLFLIVVPMFGDKILNLIHDIKLLSSFGDEIILMFNVIKWPFTFLMIYFNIKFIYVFAPDKQVESNTTSVGAFFTTIIWMIATAIFSFYIKYFASYDIIYGNLSSMIILMMWLLILSYVFVLGMVINTTDFDEKD